MIILSFIFLTSSTPSTSGEDHGMVRFSHCDMYKDTVFKGTIKSVYFFDFYSNLLYLQFTTKSDRVFYCISPDAIFDECPRMAFKLSIDLNSESQTLLYIAESPMAPDTIGLRTNKGLNYIEMFSFKTKNKLVFYNK